MQSLHNNVYITITASPHRLILICSTPSKFIYVRCINYQLEDRSPKYIDGSKRACFMFPSTVLVVSTSNLLLQCDGKMFPLKPALDFTHNETNALVWLSPNFSDIFSSHCVSRMSLWNCRIWPFVDQLKCLYWTMR